MSKDSIFSKSQKIADNNLGSCDVYHMKPGTKEKNHYHKGIEILYVLKGNCKTHKQGKVYFYKKGQAHQVINDSKEELVLVCLQIPPNLQELNT